MIRSRGCSGGPHHRDRPRGAPTARRARREAISAKPERWFAETEIEGLDAEAAIRGAGIAVAELRRG